MAVKGYKNEKVGKRIFFRKKALGSRKHLLKDFYYGDMVTCDKATASACKRSSNTYHSFKLVHCFSLQVHFAVDAHGQGWWFNSL